MNFYTHSCDSRHYRATQSKVDFDGAKAFCFDPSIGSALVVFDTLQSFEDMYQLASTGIYAQYA